MSWAIAGFALLICGSFLIHVTMTRVHEGLRAALASHPKTFEDADVRAMLTARATLAYGVHGSRGDLLVCDRCIAFFQRGRFGPQPPVVVFRTEADARAFDGSPWITRLWLTDDPVIDPDGVTLRARRSAGDWTLALRTQHPRALADAVRAMRR